MDISPPVVSLLTCLSSKRIIVKGSFVCCLCRKSSCIPFYLCLVICTGWSVGRPACYPVVSGVWVIFVCKCISWALQLFINTVWCMNQVSYYSPRMLSGLWESSVCPAEVQSGKEAGWAGCTGEHRSAFHSAGLQGGTLSWICSNVVECGFSCFLSTKMNVRLWENCRKCEKCCFPACLWDVPRTYGDTILLLWWCFFFPLQGCPIWLIC